MTILLTLLSGNKLNWGSLHIHIMCSAIELWPFSSFSAWAFKTLSWQFLASAPMNRVLQKGPTRVSPLLPLRSSVSCRLWTPVCVKHNGTQCSSKVRRKENLVFNIPERRVKAPTKMFTPKGILVLSVQLLSLVCIKYPILQKEFNIGCVLLLEPLLNRI